MQWIKYFGLILHIICSYLSCVSSLVVSPPTADVSHQHAGARAPVVLMSQTPLSRLPVILLVASPWPLLLCRTKKSLLLSVTQSFRAFFSRTSSGFSHIFFFLPAVGGREGPAAALCTCRAVEASPPVLLRVPGRPGRLYSGGFSGFSMLIRPPFPEAGFGLPLHVRCLEENASDLQQLNTPHKDRLDKRSSALELNWGVTIL